MPPKCENCLLPPILRCKPQKKSIMQCLKTVNDFVEPDISLRALRSLVGDNTQQQLPESVTATDPFPSLSLALASNEQLPYQINTPMPIFDTHNQIVAYQVTFKNGAELLFQP